MKPYQQNADDLVAAETANFDASTPWGGHGWIVTTTPEFSGTGAENYLVIAV